MEQAKKIKKKRFNFLKFIVFLLAVYLIVTAFITFGDSPIKNIIILENYNLSDEIIIETAGLENYPAFISVRNSSICKKIEKLELVSNCKIKKKFGNVIEIIVEEHKVLYKMRSNEKYVLSNNSQIDLTDNVKTSAVLINYVPDDKLNSFNKELGELSINTLAKISEIEYSPTTYDDERFILYMVDQNMVYITISKTSKLDKYDEIKKELDGHKGILYLDSGNYFEIK